MPDGSPVVATVDRDVCMGSGVCIVYAPATFEHDDEAKAVVLQPHGDTPDAIRTAANACPTGAISLSEREV